MRISDWSSDVCSSDLLAQRSKRGVSTARPIQLASVTCMPMAEVEGGACPIPILPFPSIRSLTDVPAEPPRRLIPVLETRKRSSDRKSVVKGKSVSVREGHGGRGIIQKQQTIQQ